ncbi:MAG: OsmC family protein [Micavibrio sp.]|nr:OsmC family protein [Micavibrio sp.]
MSSDKRTVTVSETGKGTFTQEVTAGKHTITTDEPEDIGGDDDGPNPYDMLLGALGSCTSMTLRMYANQKQWPLEKVSVTLTHHKEAGADNKKVDVITRDIKLEGPLDETQRARLLEIANKCPVHRTLESKPTIISALVNDGPAKTAPAPKPPTP